MNFQNVRLRSLLCAVLSVILVTGSMILPAFAAEQNVNFSYVDSVPSATVAPALWKVAGCSESLPASSAQMVLNEVATIHRTVSDGNVFTHTSHSPTILIHTGIDCDAVVTCLKMTAFDQDIITGIRVQSICIWSF